MRCNSLVKWGLIFKINCFMVALIIEDEVIAANRLFRLIESIDKDIQCVGPIGSLSEAFRWFQENPMPDLILMDIHLADGTSFEIFSQVDIQAPVIFTTAFDKYAINAFSVNAVDYLLKPIKAAQLQLAIKKFKILNTAFIPDYRQMNISEKVDLAAPKRFLIRTGGKLNVVRLEETAWFFTQNKVVYLTTWDGKKSPLDYSMEKLEEVLNGESFFRINRQFIIHIDSVTSILPHSKGRVRLILNPEYHEDVVVSAEKTPVFKKWITKN